MHCPSSSAPALPHTVELDFDKRDGHGNHATLEEALKHNILSSAMAATATAATGIMSAAKTLIPAYGLVGMAGVGKTVALQGLAGELEICNRFPGGVLYMIFGQGTTVQDAIEEIVKIMKITGASSSLAEVRGSTSLTEAVNLAVRWFRRKICLFLLDDLWPIDGCAIGYFNDLRQVLRCSFESRMAISTRSVSIAIGTGHVVDFAARDPLGSVSVRGFMKCASSPIPRDALREVHHDLCPSVQKILSMCGGLPITLSVAGYAVAHLNRTARSFESACEIYITDFCATKLGEKRNPEGKRLYDCIHLSLKYLEAEFSEWKREKAVNI